MNANERFCVRRWCVLLLAVATVCLPRAAAADPAPRETTILGPFTGLGAPLHPDNVSPRKIEYYGTDLGWSYAHDGQLHFLFGDTTATEAGAPIEASSNGVYDDSFGTISLDEWNDPTRIVPGNVPRVRLGQNPGTTEVSAINPGHAMESFKTPVGGFSNGRDQFGAFYSAKPQGCRVDADCGKGLACDAGLGYIGEPYDVDKGMTIGCIDGTPYCNADTMHGTDGKPLPGSGLCTDRSSSAWAGTDVGRVSGIAVKTLVGLRSSSDPRRYSDVHAWLTNKYSNPAIRTVRDFVPERGPGRRNQDYRPATQSGGERRVFVWGRPGFVGVGAKGRPLGLYFAYVDMPTAKEFGWTPRYFAGTDARGVPQFTSDEGSAVAIDLDSTRSGIQADEVYDVVDQMSVAWIEELGKWVMLYGGGMINLPFPQAPTCGVLEFFARSECKDVVIGDGAIRMRTADDPWGPWTPPQDVLVGGDPARTPPEGLYAPGGILGHPDCVQPGCAGHTKYTGVNPREYGFLYGVNIIEQWTRPVADGVDIIWNASTWDPYRIVLLRTRISR